MGKSIKHNASSPHPWLWGLLGTALFSAGGGCAQNSSGFPASTTTPLSLSTALQPQAATTEKVEVQFVVYTLDHQPLENVAAQTLTAPSLAASADPDSVSENGLSPLYTDNKGYISLDLPQDQNVEVVFSRSGFQSKTQSLYLQSRPAQPYLIYLEATATLEVEPATDIDVIPNQGQTLVQQYYDYLNGEKVGQAWQMLTLAAQRQHTSYSVFYGRWSRVDQIQVQDLAVVSQSDDWAVVEAKVIYLIDEQPREVAPQRFTLTWDGSAQTWQIASLEELE